jgi:pilus assembly protein CpaE
MKAVELGAQDYLPKVKLTRDELIRAIQHGIVRSRKATVEQRPQQEAGVIGVLGSKGGVGVTTLACHMARELKRETGEELLLLGLDSSTAGVSYLMKVQSTYTLVDASESLHRLDAALWKSLVTETADHIDVLPPPGAAQFTGQLNTERLHHVMRFARGIYGRIVIDLGVLGPISLGLLEEVTHLYVVANEDLAALWEAGRLLTRLSQLGLPPERVRFIVNQKKKRGGVDAADLEKAFRYPVHATVADSGEEQSELLAAGRFVDVKSQVHKETARLVAKLLGKEPPPAGRSPFGFARLNRG